MALPTAISEERQFTMHVVVETQRRFTELSVVYTNHPIWVENSINIMGMLLDEDKYTVVLFDLAFLLALCSRIPLHAQSSLAPLHMRLPAVGAGT
ncbi:hypothetical protein D1007_18288 [Hordeum vulgare]|nr:hypothetical protein D1007_18288 [Hordeum vulgare]